MSKIAARIAANHKRATATHAAFVETLRARRDADAAGKLAAGKTDKHGNPLGPAVEWDRCIKWATDDAQGAVRQIAALGRGFDFAGFVEALRITTPGNPRYVQAKVCEKVVKFVSAVFTQNAATATDYAVQVLYNALVNDGELHIDDARASLSRRCIGTDTATLATRGTYTTGTASSQASQVRMLGLYLGFAEVIKGKRDDVLRVKPDLMGDLRELFGVAAPATADAE